MANDKPVGWPARIVRLDLGTGRRERWAELAPPDPIGTHPPAGGNVVLRADGRSYVYQFHRILADLYIVEGLR